MTATPAVADPAGRGPLRFARYAYPPNALGYCGPPSPDTLLEAATGAPDLGLLRHLAGGFDGAYPYLQLIAACNHLDDPLDERVVEAYWLGNDLLARVPPPVLAASLDDRFARRAGRRFDAIAEAAVAHGGVAHHSFHVFAVYPWIGLLRAGHDGPALTVLDRCRIRPGVVRSVDGDRALVRSRPLAFDGRHLRLGGPEDQPVRWWAPAGGARAGGGPAGGGLAPGDLVSLHWDWVCERLTPSAEARLERVTRVNLDAVNASTTPGPATVLERQGG